MKTNKFGGFVLISSLMVFSSSLQAAPSMVPDPPSLGAKGYILMDYQTGKILVEHNADTPLNPASLTKLMTAYVAGQEIKSGNINMDDSVQISEKAWAKNFPDSSKMFIEVDTEVTLADLYRGLVVQSGNDASVAIAEHAAGSEAGFVGLMNTWAKKLGMSQSSFANPHGLDNEALYSTPRDIAILGQAIIRDLPDIYSLYSEQSFTYNGITQYNRNGLLRDRSMNVDGLKTGYTSGAGYSLATSATQGEMRLIAVVMGSKSAHSRESENKQLLSYGFRFFETVKPSKANEKIDSTRVWMGEEDEVSVGVAQDVFVTLQRDKVKTLSAEVSYNKHLEAPINKGDVVGEITYLAGEEPVLSTNLVALEAVEQGSWFKRFVDLIKRFVSSWF